MAKVTVYSVKLYDAANDSPVIWRRMATRKGADMMCGQVIEDSVAEIDEAQLEGAERWTAIGFNAHPRTGFRQPMMS